MKQCWYLGLSISVEGHDWHLGAALSSGVEDSFSPGKEKKEKKRLC